MEAQELGLRIVGRIKEYTDRVTKEYKLNFSAYATPAESVCYRLLEKDVAKFGIIPGVTDKGFYTNSFHIPVDFPIGAMEKLTLEAPYHQLCNGGYISYVEFDDCPTPEIVENLIFTATESEELGYFGINFHNRYCRQDGTHLETFESKCPKCGGTDIQGISRVTGYLSLDERFGPGKVLERQARLSHNNCISAYNVKR
jgi:ribonucleoside-triphosphate reductase